MRRCLVFALLIVATPLAFAQAYKWKDAQGVTHFTDAPPPGKTKYETIKTPASDAAPAASQANTQAAPTEQADAATKGGTQDTPSNRAKLCDQLRKNAEILHNEKVVTMDDGKGGTKQVDDATRQAELKKNQAQTTLYCDA
ncbi:MAG: hypothetical protein GAK28_02355 [Luteibacter sp.]|uniref:DUF4124 domain-containing protein n=1 Tax=Luteibacter sp. TaxID=1886636 RepID=UPI0013864715|nr:DUF4124 domain-containing protein [Luteibacter sp.]KAF1006681.1 MAG: hypothetical protein GAK28_02355 [Luteibacter sp.]